MTTLKNKKWFYVTFLTLIASIGVHLYLTQHFYSMKLGTASGDAICNIGSKLNCDAVSASAFSSILDVPISLIGFYSNLFLLIIAVIAHFDFSSHSEKLKKLCIIASAVIAVASILMGLISITLLGVYCLFCIFAYILSFTSLFSIILWTRGDSEPLPSSLMSLTRELRWVLGIIVAVPVLSFASNKMYLDSLGFNRFNDYMHESLFNWKSNPQQNFTKMGLNLGPENAKMHIVKFADFGCPHCKHAVPPVKAFLASHPDVSFTFKVFPLDGNCNPSAQMQKGDDSRCFISKMVFCAEKVENKGIPLYELAFENQEKLFSNPSNIKEAMMNLAQQVGVTKDLNECIGSSEILDNIKAMAQEGLNAEIRGTPTVFVNGRKLDMGQMLPVLQSVYKEIK